MEFLAEKSIEIWGPWAFVVVLLMIIVFALGKYFLARQAKWDKKDEFRTNQFIELDRKRSEDIATIQQSTLSSINLLANNVAANTNVLKDLRESIHEMNINLVKK